MKHVSADPGEVGLATILSSGLLSGGISACDPCDPCDPCVSGGFYSLVLACGNAPRPDLLSYPLHFQQVLKHHPRTLRDARPSPLPAR